MDNNEDRKALANAFGVTLQFGLTSIVAVAAGIFIGYWLDRWLSTSPWLLIVFCLLGVGAAIKALMDLAKKIQK